MDYFVLVGAVLSANILTALFLYGMAKAFRIQNGDPAPLTVVGAVVIPLLFMAAGAFLFG